MSETQDRKQRAGGPGKPSKQGHLDDKQGGNQPGQKQTAKERGPGKGGTRTASPRARAAVAARTAG